MLKHEFDLSNIIFGKKEVGMFCLFKQVKYDNHYQF